MLSVAELVVAAWLVADDGDVDNGTQDGTSDDADVDHGTQDGTSDDGATDDGTDGDGTKKDE